MPVNLAGLVKEIIYITNFLVTTAKLVIVIIVSSASLMH